MSSASSPRGPEPGAVAIVLAGGASRRMGRPKPFLTVGDAEMLERALRTAAAVCSTVLLVGADAAACRRAAMRYGWHADPGGEPEIEHDPKARTPGDSELEGHLLRGSSRLLVLTDRRPRQGPLAALETAWTHRPAGSRHFWALASDLPFVSPSLGSRLLADLRAWEAESGEETRAGGSAAPRGPAAHRGPPGAPAGARAVVAASGGRRQPLCAAYGAGALELASACLDSEVRAMHAFLERLAVRAIQPAPGEGWRLFNVNTAEQLRAARERARREEGRIAGA